MVYGTKCDFHVNENCSLHADMIKTFDTGISVGLQWATFSEPFVPHVGRQSHYLDEMCHKCHDICSSIT